MPGEVRFSITEGDRPKGADLVAIQCRAEDLRSFPPAPEAVRKAMISRLFLRFPKMSRATEEMVTSYARDIAEFPAWAISKGIMDIVSGHVLKSPEFPPSSLQVRAAVEERFKPVREELNLIAGLLEACERPISDDPPEVALEKRKTLAEAARAAMRAGAPEDRPVTPRNTRLASRFDDAKEGRNRPSPQLSDEALDKMHVRRPIERKDAA